MAENPSNIVPDQIILLEGGSKLVPAPSSSDSGKVLAVLNTNGDIGWAEDREGMAQQQADWAESDPSKVTFIANKPTIPVVDQTYSASSTNAQSGVAVAEAINGQASCQLVEGAGIDLTESNGSLVIAATVDQTYDATSADAQSGVAIAGALANINQVPASAQADASKVLTVDASGVPGWATAQGGTVDQTYNASSTNAQSGTAVAGALANIKQVPASTSADASKVLTVGSGGVPEWATASGGSSVNAGEGIIKTSDTLSVNLGYGNTLLHFGSTILGYAGDSDGVYTVQSSDLRDVYYIRTENSSFSMEWTWSSKPSKAYLYIADGPNLNYASNVAKYTPVGSELSFDISNYGYQQIAIQPYNIKLSDQINQYTTTMERGTWASLASSQTIYIMFACLYNYQFYTFTAYNDGAVKQKYLATDNKLGCTNPLPAYSASDVGKVLQVQADGSLAWVTLS